MEDHYKPDSLREESKDVQLETMEAWFRTMFEDPVERTPYESREGGYVWIWGGPYEAADELYGKFGGIVPDEVIDELAGKLDGECPEWAPTERPGDYDEGLFEAISSNAVARRTLDDALKTIQNLLGINVPSELATAYNRLLFANAIAALETYLSDTFINRVLADQELLQKYVDSDPVFKERKVAYKDVLREASRLEQKARAELLDLVWHNIGRVKPLYAQVLDVDLGDVSAIGAAIQTRHDIVHRNGRTKNGDPIEISAAQISALLIEITELAARIEIKLDFGINQFPLGDENADF
jgi:hypothetical protein